MKYSPHFNMSVPLICVALLGFITGRAYGRDEMIVAAVLGLFLTIVVAYSVVIYGEVRPKKRS